MFYAYVLKSVEHGYYYKGHSKDLSGRLLQHNSGITEFIRPYIPFEIAYYEEFETETGAIARQNWEKYKENSEEMKKMQEKMVGYTEMYLTGSREIYQVGNYYTKHKISITCYNFTACLVAADL